MELFGTLLHGDTPHSQFTHSYISSYIPKPGKDPSIPDNCRPIALLNSDYKIFTKILSSTLSQFISKLVNGDQVGFVPSRHAMDNTRRTIDLFDFLNKFPHPGIAQKVFDRLSWLYMFSTLSPFGFKGPFLKALQALYFLTSAKVQVAFFFISLVPHVKRYQTVVHSVPLLFLLCLEPLAEAIRSHPDIKGVLMRQRAYKLSLFADDILLTLTNPTISLPSRHALLHTVGSISGYKINTAKTEASPYAYHQML